jgi:hypothetical protein
MGLKRLVSLTNMSLACIVLCAQGSFARETIPFQDTRRYIPQAIQIQITPRGMSFFENRLLDVLSLYGVGLEAGYVPEINFEAHRPVSLEPSGRLGEQGALILQTKALLQKWLVGFSLKEIRPGIQITDTLYEAEFERFALLAEPEVLKSLGKSSGAVLAIEMSVKDLTVKSDRVRAFDLNNRFLGEVGLDGLEVKVGATQERLKLRLPFYVTINSEGQLHFEALKLESNLDEVSISMNYKNLIVPKIALEINGQRFVFNEDELQKEFESRLPDILVELRKKLSEFGQKELPQFLNDKAREFLNGSLEEVQFMDPPGSESPDPNPFVWGMRVAQINQNPSLNIKLDSFVEDPLLQRHASLNPRLGSRGPVQFNQLPTTNYDIALSVDRGMINRVLEHSFRRRLFEKISMGAETDPKTCRELPRKPGQKEKFLRLTQVPAIDYVQYAAPAGLTADQTFLKLNTRVQVPPGTVTGIKKAALNDNFEISMELIAKLRPSLQGKGLDILFYDINRNSIHLDESYLTVLGKLMKDKVLSGIRDELAATARCWKIKENSISGTLPLPPEILGIDLGIQKLTMDPAGHIVMYMNYKQQNAGGRQ